MRSGFRADTRTRGLTGSNRSFFRGPTPQTIIARVTSRIVANCHSYGAASVADVFFFDGLMTHAVEVLHGSLIHLTELGIEWEANFIPHRDVAGRPRARIDMAALEVSKDTDVVHGTIIAADFKSRLIARR